MNKIDLPYLEDLYSHSQWSMPLSTRIMSDGDLYIVAGSRLINGASSFSINPEVPPIGKYLYGLGASWRENPYLISAILYLFTLLLISAISDQVFKNKKLSKTATFLFSLSPILVSQISQAALDLAQLVFLLTHVLFLLLANNSKQKKYWLYIFMSGISLGLFAATKIPIFVLPILILDYLFIKKPKKISSAVALAILTGFTYLISYAPTIINQKMNILDWIRNQLWMLNFYRISQVKSNPIYYLSAVFIGRYKGWWEDSLWESVREWTILWPISIFAAIKFKISQIFKNDTEKQFGYIANIGIGFLLIWLFIPFWARYFLLALPFLIISLVKVLENKKILLNILKTISLVWFLLCLFPNPKYLLQTVEEKFSDGNYQDFYNFIETDTNSNDFFLTLNNTEVETKAQEMSFQFVKYPKFNLLKKEFLVDAKVTYLTPIGEYQQTCQMPIIKKQNRWRLVWKWECIAPDFKEGDLLKTNISAAKQGNLLNEEGIILSQWKNDNFIYIDTTKMTADTVLEQKLATVLEIKEAQVEEMLHIRFRGSKKAPAGFIIQEAPKEIINDLKDNPAVIFELIPNRIYNPSLSQKELAQVKSIEKEHPELLGKDGGEFVHEGATESSILFKKEAVDGRDVIINFKQGSL